MIRFSHQVKSHPFYSFDNQAKNNDLLIIDDFTFLPLIGSIVLPRFIVTVLFDISNNTNSSMLLSLNFEMNWHLKVEVPSLYLSLPLTQYVP